MKIEVEYLADHPELVHVLSTWFHDEWGRNNPSLTVESIERHVRERLNRDKFPLCLVAFVNSDLIATSSLKIREMEIYPQFEHWLGNVYVLPEYRSQGIGSEITEATTETASLLGVKKLYLYTRDKENFYQRLGWETVEQTEYRGRMAVVMSRSLGS